MAISHDSLNMHAPDHTDRIDVLTAITELQQVQKFMKTVRVNTDLVAQSKGCRCIEIDRPRNWIGGMGKFATPPAGTACLLP
jgi:hypothetical protein